MGQYYSGGYTEDAATRPCPVNVYVHGDHQPPDLLRLIARSLASFLLLLRPGVKDITVRRLRFSRSPPHWALPGPSGRSVSSRFLQSARLSLSPMLSRSSLLTGTCASKSNVLLSR